MSLSTALNAAISGLHVTSRGTQVIADNIANAGTDGYGVRTLTQAARSVGGTGSGVITTGIRREGDPALLTAARLANGERDGAALTTAFWTQFEQSLGGSGDPGSLVARLSNLDAALSTAVAAPDSRASLANAVQAAVDVTQGFHVAQTVIAQARDKADDDIARGVTALNELLAQVARVNKDIQLQTVTGGSPNALMDQRQVLIDQVSLILPVTEIPRDLGRIMLLAADGTVLLDQQPAVFGFQRSPQPQPGDTSMSGGVAQITLGLRSIGIGHPLLGQGQLAASFAIRDDHALVAQSELDRVAADLVTRFAGPGIDPSVPAGAFGLFDDPGTAPPLAALGLSGRIAVSPSLDPNDPASLFRLRDGLGVSGPGPVGSTDILINLRDALRTLTPAGQPGQPARDIYGHGMDVLSQVSSNRLRAEAREAQAANRATLLQEQVLGKGVDTDAQLQRLLVLEQSYAANARVLTTIDAMMRTLLEI